MIKQGRGSKCLETCSSVFLSFLRLCLTATEMLPSAWSRPGSRGAGQWPNGDRPASAVLPFPTPGGGGRLEDPGSFPTSHEARFTE